MKMSFQLLGSLLISGTFCNVFSTNTANDERDEKLGDHLIDFSLAVDDPESGLRCVLEKGSIETVSRARRLSCVHSLLHVCHTSYVTQFRQHREQLCQDHYAKTCVIVFTRQAS